MESAVPVDTLWVPPVIPHKYDVIPIHNSDRAAFKRCRRYWDWTSPARHNLSPRADLVGINTNLWFGTGIHYALEQFYQPGIRHDPVEAWKTWFDIQVRGGTVTEEWLDRVYDLNPQPNRLLSGALDLGAEQQQYETWKVKGLMDILPDPELYELDELLELGIQMMTAYKEYARQNDGFEVIATEHMFSIPVWDFENKCILKAVDLREQSPNYGKKLEVHSRGRMDDIWVKPSGKLGIMDHKTSSRIDDEFFDALETDEQCTSYLHAAEIEAKYYNLPYAGEPMEEVIYNVLRKAYPKEPTMVRGGLFSVDRANESTTHELLMAFIEENQIDIDSLDEKHKNYIDYVREIGDEQFFIRKNVRRNKNQLVSAGYRLYQESLDMLNPDLQIYPNLNNFSCRSCSFRAPCLAMEDGSDWRQLINDNYTQNRDR